MTPDQGNPNANAWSATRPVIVGLVALVALFAGLGFWGMATEISGAVISSGRIQVETFRQVVQHQNGGVVEQINVKEGDIVNAGDVLIRFDNTLVKSEIAIIEGQLYEFQARQARLIAERDGSDQIEFDEALLAITAKNEALQDLLSGQSRLFTARNRSLRKEQERLAERNLQTENEIAGATIQLDALRQQIDLIGQELKDQQSLLKKGLAQASRVLSLQREQARLQGQVGQQQASIARASGQITETGIEILKLETNRREQAITTLRDLQYRIIELTERQLAANESLSRLEIRAPMSGVIYGLQVHALRSVVQPAEPIMYVVPQDSKLVISTRVSAIHIDRVQIGQEASLRFPTFDQRTTPEIIGHVTKLSADVFTDQTTGMTYYAAEIQPADSELEKLEMLDLLPGMPVEAFIKTADRTPLSYLVKPFTDYFNRAFRE